MGVLRAYFNISSSCFQAINAIWRNKKPYC